MTRGAVWATPVAVVAAQAPAYAASSCKTTTTLNWDSGTYSRSADGTSLVYTLPDPDGSGPGQGMTLTVATSFLGSNTQLGSQKFNGRTGLGSQSCTCNDNLVVSPTVVGGDRGLTLHQSPISNTAKSNSFTDPNKSITTFTFSQPVSDLSFTLIDIDSTYEDFWDAIAVTGATYTASKAGTSMLGTGTVSDPFRINGNDIAVADGSSAGNVTLTFTQQVTSFNLHYWNIASTFYSAIDGDQRVFIGDMKLTYFAC